MTKSWNTPVDIETIICPVVVTYHEADKKISICREHTELALKSVEGVEEVYKKKVVQLVWPFRMALLRSHFVTV